MGKQFDDVSYGDVDAYIANYFMIGYDPDEADPADQTKRLGLDTLFSILNVPGGYMFNGKLSVTLSSSDLVIAVKGLDGNNPSSTNPVRVRIGDVEHTLTAALSVTVPDGGNTFNTGASEFATLAQDYFAYLRYNATDGVCLGASRIPYARLYSDFAANGDDETMTNEKGAVWNDITNAAAGDVCQVVGRFTATHAGAAGYAWSSPANVISEPIYETRPLSYVPTATPGAGAFTSKTGSGVYILKGSSLKIFPRLSITTNGTAASYTLLSLPFTVIASKGHGCGYENAVSGKIVFARISSDTTNLVFTDFAGAYVGDDGYVVDITIDARLV